MMIPSVRSRRSSVSHDILLEGDKGEDVIVALEMRPAVVVPVIIVVVSRMTIPISSLIPILSLISISFFLLMAIVSGTWNRSLLALFLVVFSACTSSSSCETPFVLMSGPVIPCRGLGRDGDSKRDR